MRVPFDGEGVDTRRVGSVGVIVGVERETELFGSSDVERSGRAESRREVSRVWAHHVVAVVGDGVQALAHCHVELDEIPRNRRVGVLVAQVSLFGWRESVEGIARVLERDCAGRSCADSVLEVREERLQTVAFGRVPVVWRNIVFEEGKLIVCLRVGKWLVIAIDQHILKVWLECE